MRKKFRVVAEYIWEVFLRVSWEGRRERHLRVSADSADAFDAVFCLPLLIADDILINLMS